MGILLGVLLTVTPLFFGSNTVQAAVPGSRSMHHLINELEQYVDAENWTEAGHAVKELDRHFRRKYWLLQLLGDEEEYEGIDRNMAQVTAAVKERDKTQVKLLLAETRMMLRHIFSL